MISNFVAPKLGADAIHGSRPVFLPNVVGLL